MYVGILCTRRFHFSSILDFSFTCRPLKGQDQAYEIVKPQAVTYSFNICLSIKLFLPVHFSVQLLQDTFVLTSPTLGDACWGARPATGIVRISQNLAGARIVLRSSILWRNAEATTQRPQEPGQPENKLHQLNIIPKVWSFQSR